MSLLPCPSCGRHVRRSEIACPFCAASISFEGVAVRGVPAQRLGRAATFAFGAAAATAVGASALTGCSHSEYGGPPSDSGVDSALPEDAFVGGFDAAYGGPPVDAGPSDVDAGGDGGLAGAYGAPPVDAGNTEDSGGGGAMYGAPPP